MADSEKHKPEERLEPVKWEDLGQVLKEHQDRGVLVDEIISGDGKVIYKAHPDKVPPLPFRKKKQGPSGQG
jgi:hypothetical protein